MKYSVFSCPSNVPLACAVIPLTCHSTITSGRLDLSILRSSRFRCGRCLDKKEKRCQAFFSPVATPESIKKKYGEVAAPTVADGATESADALALGKIATPKNGDDYVRWTPKIGPVVKLCDYGGYGF
jgi:hypothetical protein